MKAFPATVEGLLDMLSAENPSRCRKPGESELEHERYAGRVDLIDECRSRLDAATKKESKGLPKVL